MKLSFVSKAGLKPIPKKRPADRATGEIRNPADISCCVVQCVYLLTILTVAQVAPVTFQTLRVRGKRHSQAR